MHLPFRRGCQILIATAAIALPLAAAGQCKLSDVEVKITKIRWHDGCRATPCPSLKGAAVLTNKCAVPVGVLVRLVGLDGNGTPIAVNEAWPFSTGSAPPGASPFSLDLWLEYDADVTQFSIEPVRLRR